MLNATCEQRCGAAVLTGRGRLNRVSPASEFSCSTLPFNFCLTNARVIKEDSEPDDCIKQLLGLPLCRWCWAEDAAGRRLAGCICVPWKVAAPVRGRTVPCQRNQSPRPCAREPTVQSAAPAQDAAHPVETQRLVPSLASLAAPRAGAEPNPWATSALTAASEGPRQPLPMPVPGKFVFIMNKCPPAPPGWVGKWKEGNSGNKSVPTTLHPGQHVLRTSKGGRNTWGLLSSSSPSFLLEA